MSFAWVHDLVRPCVSRALMERLKLALGTLSDRAGAGVVPTISPVETVRYRGGESSGILREEVLLMQTPQIFRLGELVDALSAGIFHNGSDVFTDEAGAMMSHFGVCPTWVEGEQCNVKITHPQDVVLAEFWYSKL